MFYIHPYKPTGPGRDSAPLGTEPSSRNAAEAFAAAWPREGTSAPPGGLVQGVGVDSCEAMVSWKDDELWQNPSSTT